MKKIGEKAHTKKLRRVKKQESVKKALNPKKQEGKKRENLQKEPISKIVNGENKKVTTNNH